MIIICNSCDKKFDIASNLIAEKGRLLKCSSCGYEWFFKKKIIHSEKKVPVLPILDDQKDIIIKKKENQYSINVEKSKMLSKVVNYNNSNSELNTKNNKIKNKNKHPLLTFILVFIISFIAIIILIDTFKYPLSKVIPNIDIKLYNLYETIIDIILFFKDLM